MGGILQRTVYKRSLTRTKVITELKEQITSIRSELAAEPTKYEVEIACKKLKNNKSAGFDNVPGELIKLGGKEMTDVMYKLCTLIWKTEKIPTDWTKSILILLPKKGDLKECSNYRTISLICHASKILLRIIQDRLKSIVDVSIGEEQAGFREGRSTIEQIFCLRLIGEKSIEYNQVIYNCFIDFQKAFDSVPHDVLWEVLKYYSVPSNIINILKELYSNAESAALINGEQTNFFKTTKGCRQGCILSPVLFLFYLEKIMEEALEGFDGGIKIGKEKLNNLRFADDIADVYKTKTKTLIKKKQLCN